MKSNIKKLMEATKKNTTKKKTKTKLRISSSDRKRK